jgi:hypothetical protein
VVPALMLEQVRRGREWSVNWLAARLAPDLW